MKQDAARRILMENAPGTPGATVRMSTAPGDRPAGPMDRPRLRLVPPAPDMPGASYEEVVALFAVAWAVSGLLFAALSWGSTRDSSSQTVTGEPRTPETAPPLVPALRPISPAVRLAGGLALVALLVCLALPLWIFFSSTGDDAARMETFKTALLGASILYFVCGSVWVYRSSRAARGG